MIMRLKTISLKNIIILRRDIFIAPISTLFFRVLKNFKNPCISIDREAAEKMRPDFDDFSSLHSDRLLNFIKSKYQDIFQRLYHIFAK